MLTQAGGLVGLEELSPKQRFFLPSRRLSDPVKLSDAVRRLSPQDPGRASDGLLLSLWHRLL